METCEGYSNTANRSKFSNYNMVKLKLKVNRNISSKYCHRHNKIPTPCLVLLVWSSGGGNVGVLKSASYRAGQITKLSTFVEMPKDGAVRRLSPSRRNPFSSVTCWSNVTSPLGNLSLVTSLVWLGKLTRLSSGSNRAFSLMQNSICSRLHKLAENANRSSREVFSDLSLDMKHESLI